jgi:aminoglycoside phosphotransferase (APT) family kinase protein
VLNAALDALGFPMHGREHLEDLVARAVDRPLRTVTITERPLRGGIEGALVTELVARYVDAAGRPGLLRLVAKHLSAATAREAAVYERVVGPHVASLGPPLVGVLPVDGAVVVYMASMRRGVAWPWREVAVARRVLDVIAELHDSSAAARAMPPWDYEAQLQARAGEALAAVDRVRRGPVALDLRGSSRLLRRLVGALPAWRRALLSGPLAPCPIHGDLHTGNVVAGAGAPPRVTLLDWSRARMGSPLEDVSSWLQSLAFWEPEVRRRHDTLLNGYLAARGVRTPASDALRSVYWLAGASNALSGALAFHLDVATSPEISPRRRARSLEAARDWLRILRRADVVWSAPSGETPAGRRVLRRRPPMPSLVVTPARPPARKQPG